jgi:hypothetical protein
MILPMTTVETPLESPEMPRRFQFGWVLPALFRPRPTFGKIAAQNGDVWLTPILILMLVAVLRTVAAGSIKQAAAANGLVTPPAGFQYYTPEQQTQSQQAQSAMSGPVFIYVFPAVLAALETWVGWLLVVGLLHLVLTMLGGRGASRQAMNLVAWASLPFAVRDGVRIIYLLVTHQLISRTGLAGFAPTDGGDGSAYLAQLLAFFDIYLIWHALLLVTGVRAGDKLAAGKAWGGVLITLAIVLLLEALPGFGLTKLGTLNVIQPFFF